MRKEWLWIGIAGVLLSACTSQPPAPQQQVQQTYNGPVVEIGGAEPRYEPFNPSFNQDYKVNGQSYSIVKDPQNFSQIGLAAWYGEEANGNTTATGETFDPNALTAAHPTLPIPSYVRVTNVSNGRQIVVRVNDRGPYTSGRVIDLSKAAADRLNISNNTKVKIDFINVAPDGSLSGPGMVGTTIAKQSYALPSRPDLGSSGMGTPIQQDAPAVSAPVLPIDNSHLSGADATQPVAPQSSGFLRASTPVPVGVLEGSEPATVSSSAMSSAPVTPPVVANPGPVTSSVASASTGAATSGGYGYVVQVGALSDAQRAQTWQQSLSQRFGVPGKVATNGSVHRVQLGPFSSRQQAVELQQRLSSEAQQQSFVVAAP
ncbi:Rare lipoprotein A [Yersinia mollaretii ATCC 43969]|uniref:Endolytic peptidoglycan transglycosylase RlpA n=1 Tax=Yersinia mollaretii (strain ATCC 43969 / DSM 18520 / CIP 103324 / CNY 7263 / WAIP 204) TaxID=349967 RepID=A0ABP2EK48_YERMW|nr:endolytic peptidoglycan transglycosylase RlpA [Yersinia mollaretii]EEQ12330.1 Rare lipoprotein A [Yersinia mollaretii ATCC 43969]QKJ03521.1 endolytic peptidoglycan transglycosylase RlpA [Yersinia mollaretii ATCC 43969]